MRPINKQKFYRTLEAIEKIILILFLLHYAGAVVGVITQNGASEGDAVKITDFDFSFSRNLYLLSYLFAGFGVIIHWQRVLYLVGRNGFWLKAFLLIGTLSVFWTITPEETNSAVIGLIGTALFALYISARFSIKEQLELAEIVCKIIVVLSIVFVLALPKYGLEHGIHAGAFRGVFTSKNVLGGFMVFSICVFLQQRNQKRSNFFLSWLWVALSFALLALCQSTGALVNILIVLLASYCVTRLLKFETKVVIPFFILLILGMWFLSALSNELMNIVLPMIGKDPTLTGRSDIWAFVISDILERPLFGYGYAGYWGNKDVIEALVRELYWAPPGPHNGFLAIAIDLGLVGLACYLLSMLEIITNSFALTRRRNVPAYLFWPFTYVIYLICTRFAEDGLFSHGSIFSLLYISMYFSILAESRIFQRQVRQAVA